MKIRYVMLLISLIAVLIALITNKIEYAIFYISCTVLLNELLKEME